MGTAKGRVWWVASLCILLCLAALGGGYRYAISRSHGEAIDRSAVHPQRLYVTHEQGGSNDRSLALPQAERSYIWRIEHFVVLLDFRFWPGLSSAIREQDFDKAGSFFAPGATAELIDDEQATSESLGFAEFHTAATEIAGSRSATLHELLDYLFARVVQFDSGVQVSIKTVFLSPGDRARPNGPWQGRFVLRVWGQSKDQRPAEVVIEADFALAMLADEVPKPAPWLTSCKIVRESHRRADQFLMTEVGSAWGFDGSRFHDNWQHPAIFPRMITGGVYLSDYDLDGRIDVLVTDIKGCVLYHQVTPGKFEDATVAAGLQDIPPGVAVAFADLDNDSYPDLIAGNQIYRNTGRGTFEHVAVLGSLPDPQMVNGFAIADYDRDGLLDIYVTRAAPSPNKADGKASWLSDRTGQGNTLLRNLGDWRFQDVTAASAASAGTVSCFAAAWFDANNDMWPDLFVSDEFGSPVLLVNRKDGSFESRSITGNFGGFCMGMAAGDLDDDGRIDLYLANMYSKAGERVLSNLNMSFYPPEIAAKICHIVDGSELWHNGGDLHFESKGRAAGVARVGWAYGPCLADLDNDGRLDIYAPAGFLSVSRNEPDG